MRVAQCVYIALSGSRSQTYSTSIEQAPFFVLGCVRCMWVCLVYMGVLCVCASASESASGTVAPPSNETSTERRRRRTTNMRKTKTANTSSGAHAIAIATSTCVLHGHACVR